MDYNELVELTKYPGYYVNKAGDVYSSFVKGGQGSSDTNNLHKLSYGSDRDGYYRVVLSANGKKKYVKVHTLIVEQFIGPVVAPMVVNHKDGNKRNNRLDNLEIVSVRENTVHAHKSGLTTTEIPVLVEHDGSAVFFSSLAECMNAIPDLSRHYLSQLRNGVILFSMVYFKKEDPTNRRSRIECYYNGRLLEVLPSMRDCDIRFGMAIGATSSAIQHCQYRKKINKYHVTFPNVSTIENTPVNGGSE